MFGLSRSLAKAKARGAKRGYNTIVEEAMRYAGVALDTNALNQALKARADKLVAPVKDAYPLLAFLRSSHDNGYKCPTTQAEHIIAYVNANTGE